MGSSEAGPVDKIEGKSARRSLHGISSRRVAFAASEIRATHAVYAFGPLFCLRTQLFLFQIASRVSGTRYWVSGTIYRVCLLDIALLVIF